MFRPYVTLAVFQRNVASYFAGMLGYLFMITFVVAGSFVAYGDQFFTNNQCDLDQLSAYFPYLLLFIIPAITMSVWADERKQGTDELLFTLPATDWEVILGKYFAVLAVYTLTLAFSLTHVIVLLILGSPDWGMIISTFFGYWLAGGALLAIGMFASVLTSSSTVAFVLGAAMCAIPVFVDRIPGLTSLLTWMNIREPISIAGRLNDFTLGLIPLGGVAYFVGIIVVFLYLNAVMVARRHWAGSPESASQGTQYAIRAVSLAVTAVTATYFIALLTGQLGFDIDLTKERLYSLSSATEKVLGTIPKEKPITLTAYVSSDVPESYVPVRKKLLGMMRQFGRHGGNRLMARVVDVEPLSKEAEQAAKWGISSRRVLSQSGSSVSQKEIFMGLVATSGYDQVVIPYFGRGTPIEYEMTRAVGTVSKQERMKIGVLETDAKVMGGMNMQTFSPDPEWKLIQELKKQYDVVKVDPKEPIKKDAFKVLLAIMPSTMTEPEMKNVVDYVKTGAPILVFDDPAPVWVGPQLAPSRPKPNPGGGMMGMQLNQGGGRRRGRGGGPPDAGRRQGDLAARIARHRLEHHRRPVRHVQPASAVPGHAEAVPVHDGQVVRQAGSRHQSPGPDHQRSAGDRRGLCRRGREAGEFEGRVHAAVRDAAEDLRHRSVQQPVQERLSRSRDARPRCPRGRGRRAARRRSADRVEGEGRSGQRDLHRRRRHAQ